MTDMTVSTARRHPAHWLKNAPQGLSCPMGGFHIDPIRPVERAVITHGHSDHARPGHGAVLATPETIAIMQARHGTEFPTRYQTLAYGEAIRLGDVTVSLTPAGHVLGSAQVVLEYGGARVVVSGEPALPVGGL
jgi:putative mRNA 3-end processing factor